ncbi:50S ribosomal protein L35 [Candidatus Babeliales bacterium]|nr:50S ribosomal protein L35 [Candidatus Babeliales bacterium]
MPKMKSHSASKKRFKKSASGKIKRAQAYKRHHSWAKTKKRTRQLGQEAFFMPCDKKKIDALLPYA